MKQQAKIIASQMTIGEAQLMFALPCFVKANTYQSFFKKYRNNNLFRCVETEANFRGGYLRVITTKLGEAVICEIRDRLARVPLPPRKRKRTGFVYPQQSNMESQ